MELFQCCSAWRLQLRRTAPHDNRWSPGTKQAPKLKIKDKSKEEFKRWKSIMKATSEK
jgi:hypothetical protein